MIADDILIPFYIRLTPRQRDVVLLASEGLTNAEIAKRLSVQPCVVAGHLTNIYGEMSTLEACQDQYPNRYTLIRAFAGFFERHPNFANV